MLFHEIYGSYYTVIARVLSLAIEKKLDKKKLDRIIRENAFDESRIHIPDKLIGGDYNLLSDTLEAKLKDRPVMPLTTLQKRWLKAISLDPKIRLFDPDLQGLNDVRPLFTPEMIRYFDQSTDKDPYTSKTYIENFQVIQKAIEEKLPLQVFYETAKGNGKVTLLYGYPDVLEYSPKDDKFRLCLWKGRQGEKDQKDKRTLNLARIKEVMIISFEQYQNVEKKRRKESGFLSGKKTVILEVTDERNALERVLLHFSHLEKETVKLDEEHYRIRLVYDDSDETEMLIRILAFGPMVRVTGPEHFIARMRDRLQRQKDLMEEE